MTDTPMIAGVLVIGCFALLLLIRMRRALGTALSSAATGMAAMAAVNVTGMLTGVTLPWTPFSLLVCLVLGAPGVVSLLVLQLFW